MPGAGTLMRAYFVVGTDTGVGKTFIACTLAAAARRAGLAVKALKPVETGCARAPGGRLIPADAVALAQAAGHPDHGWNDPWLFRHEMAIAPAATPSGGLTDLAWLVGALGPLVEGADAVIVEGAGGLLTPLGPGVTIADLALALRFPLLLVAENHLGVINHTLLTLEAARARGLHVASVVLNTNEPVDRADLDASLPTNAGLIAEHGRVPVLGPCPFIASRDTTAALRALPALEALWR